MDDVFRQVVLTEGDEDLLPEQAEAAVILAHRARRDLGQIGARLRLGQVHGARPLARDQVGHVFLALRVRAHGQHRFDDPIGQHRAQGKRQAGGLDVLGRRGRNQLGQALPAPGLRMLQALPAARGVVLEALGIARCGGDLPIVPDGRMRVAGHIQRRHRLLNKAAVLLQDGVNQVRRHVVKTGQFKDVVQAGQFFQREAEIL
ncbi:hypothetical protein D3C71_1043570 [compost metagenome]